MQQLDEVGHVFLGRAGGGDGEDRHLGVDRGERAVAEVGRGEAVGEDAARLLDLQRRLECRPVEHPTSGHHEPLRARQALRGLLRRLGVGERRRHDIRQRAELDVAVGGRTEAAREHGERDHLCRDGLRRGHRALGPHPEIEDGVCARCELALRVVGDRDRARAGAAQLAQRRDDLGRAPRLADPDGEVSAQVELGAVEREHARRREAQRPPSGRLDEIAAVCGRMVGGPARGDRDAGERLGHHRADALGERPRPPGERGEALGLLGHLGGHEVAGARYRHAHCLLWAGVPVVRARARGRSRAASASRSSGASGQRPPFSQNSRIASSGRPVVSGAIAQMKIHDTTASPRKIANVAVPPRFWNTLGKKREMMRFATRSAVSIAEAPAVRKRAGKLSEA